MEFVCMYVNKLLTVLAVQSWSTVGAAFLFIVALEDGTFSHIIFNHVIFLYVFIYLFIYFKGQPVKSFKR